MFNSFILAWRGEENPGKMLRLFVKILNTKLRCRDPLKWLETLLSNQRPEQSFKYWNNILVAGIRLYIFVEIKFVE